MCPRFFLCSVVMLAALDASASAQVGTLANPFPQPSPNAALHYQRAILLLSALDEADKNLLKKDIWETSPGLEPVDGQAARLKRMLYRARHSIDAAAKGARQQTCDFGIDFADAGAATLLPHVEPLVELGRLLCVRGAYAQSQGDWDEAAVIYFDTLRIGRHLTHQPTLLEAVAGMTVLENGYYALAHWAIDCPDKAAVQRAFGLMEIMADDLIQPAVTLAHETSILALDFEILQRSFPKGPWGTTILQSLGKDPTEDEKQNRKLAVAACVEAGVPAAVFESAEAYRKYVAGLERLELRFAEAASACMKLPAQARVRRGQQLYDRYTEKAGAVGNASLLNPAEIGAAFAGHEAKVTLLRVVLAVAAQRNKDKYPTQLQDVASGFGGNLPASPYDGSPVEYEVLDGGKSVQLVIKEVRVGAFLLPRVEFASDLPADAQ